MALTYLKKEGAAFHPETYKHSQHHNGRPEWHCGVWVKTRKIGNLKVKEEVCE